MSAIMTIDAGDNDKIASYIEELKKMKIPVLQPDINLSFKDFGVIKKEQTGEERDQIRFGFKTIKNLGEAISEQIVEERKEEVEKQTYRPNSTNVTEGNVCEDIEAIAL